MKDKQYNVDSDPEVPTSWGQTHPKDHITIVMNKLQRDKLREGVDYRDA